MLTTVLLVLLLVLAAALLGLLFCRRGSPAQGDLPALKADLKQISDALRLLTTGQGESHSSERRLEGDLKGALERIDRLQVRLEERSKQEGERATAQIQLLERLGNVLLGSKQAGLLGENIVKDQMSRLLPEWVVANFKIGSRVVEFGFRLFDGRIIPIDSKVVAVEKIAALQTTSDEREKTALTREINREMSKKVREVKQYIDPTVTYHKAVVAVPDAVYGILNFEVFNEAGRGNVYLLPYSTLAPFLMMILEIERRSEASLSAQKVQAFLSNLKKALHELKDLMDNSIARGNKTIGNAHERASVIIHSLMIGLDVLGEEEFEVGELEKVV